MPLRRLDDVDAYADYAYYCFHIRQYFPDYCFLQRHASAAIRAWWWRAITLTLRLRYYRAASQLPAKAPPRPCWAPGAAGRYAGRQRAMPAGEGWAAMPLTRVIITYATLFFFWCRFVGLSTYSETLSRHYDITPTLMAITPYHTMMSYYASHAAIRQAAIDTRYVTLAPQGHFMPPLLLASFRYASHITLYYCHDTPLLILMTPRIFHVTPYYAILWIITPPYCRDYFASALCAIITTAMPNIYRHILLFIDDADYSCYDIDIHIRHWWPTYMATRRWLRCVTLD